MLRFLCKLRESEIIEPLVPSIKACLEHRHSYVRKNAALGLYHILKHHGQALVPDGAELIDSFVKHESDVGSRRNAFLMLVHEAEELAIDFLAALSDGLDHFGDGFALLVLELIRKVCRRDSQQKARFLQHLFQLLASSSAAVSYEAAWTLVGLSTSPTAVRSAASTYTTLLTSQSDNNVKLIVLERIAEIKRRDAKAVADVLMDLLRALASPNVDICKRTLEIALDLVSSRNIEDVVQVLKREIIRTRDSDLEKGTEYRALLIHSVHTCALKFPEIADSVIYVLMDFLGVEGAMDVVIFVRAIVAQYPPLRPTILDKLVLSLGDIQAAPVLAVALWIIGEYSEDDEKLEAGFDELIAVSGMADAASHDVDDVATERADSTSVSKTVVLPDGTYAFQQTPDPARGGAASLFQRLIRSGDFFLGTVMAGALTKLALRTRVRYGINTQLATARALASLHVICGVASLIDSSNVGDNSLSAGSSKTSATNHPEVAFVGASADCLERLSFFARLLLSERLSEDIQTAFLSDGKCSFSLYLNYAKTSLPPTPSSGTYADTSRSSVEQKLNGSQPDDLIAWRQLRVRELASGELDLFDGDDLTRATGLFESTDVMTTRLSHVYQLSGFADPVYAEAYVTVHDYDILLEILLVNRTPATLTNLTVELNTMGDLKLVERPLSLTIGPLDQRSINANIKVSSTETGHIFGTIVYENSSTAEKTHINLNNIHLDIMDYIRPAVCSDEIFRSMWAEFEWENKVAISTSISALDEFLEHIVVATNMTCLTPRAALCGTSSFLAANLYAKSIFGEDALVNVSVEKKDDADGKLSGYIRIRSKTQGIALSLGDRITSVQRSSATARK